MRWLPYESSRGCPSHRTFCINVVTDNRRYRKKSAGKVISEIEYIVKKYNLTHLKIIDDNFFVDIRRVREICEGIISKALISHGMANAAAIISEMGCWMMKH